MALPKPSDFINWTDGDAAKVEQPSNAKQLLGWVASERPQFKHMNYNFYILDQWTKYLESITDELSSSKQVIVDAGGNGDFTDLQAAHDDAGTVAGTKILITSNLSIDASVNLTKPDLEYEMRPGYSIQKGVGAPATGFQGVIIGNTADRNRFKHFKVGDAGAPFSGTGDVAMTLDSAADNCFFFNNIFDDSNDTNLDDGGNTTYINQAEQVY